MMNKIIFVDFSVFMFRAIFARSGIIAKRNKQITEIISSSKSDDIKRTEIDKVKKGFIPSSTYTTTVMLISTLKKLDIKPNDIIILALDSPLGSWRREIDFSYKKNRKADREKHVDINWDGEFESFNNFLDNIDRSTPFQLIEINKCLSGDTRIHSSKGSIPIKNIKKGDKVYSYNFEKKQIELSTVLNTQKSRSYVRYNIFFENKKSPLQITEEHPVYTLCGWKKVKELNLADIIWNYFDFKMNTPNKQSFLGYFYGYLTGDGSINYKTKKITFTSCDIEGIKYLGYMSNRYFGCKNNIKKYKRKEKNTKEYNLLTLNLRDRFFSVVNFNKYSKNIEYKKGFIGGFFDAEGTFNNKRKIIRIVNTDKKPIYYIYYALKKFGFNPKIYKFKDFRNTKRQDIYAIDLNGKEQVIKFFQTFKTCIKRKKINTISNGLKIRRIEKIEDREGYNNHNFECSPNNNYFANGLLVHNCEADDIISVGVRYFKDRECVVVSNDSDYEQLAAFKNVKIFSPKSKKFKVIKNPYTILEKKIEKEKTDGLTDKILSSEDYEKRNKIVNLLSLPKEIEDEVSLELKKIYPKNFNLQYFPFQSLTKRLVEIYLND